MLLTVCTIRQLPQALALGESFCRHHPNQPFVIGLADDIAQLPSPHKISYPILSLAECLPDQINSLSERYTTTEFVAACKPAFIKTAFERYPAEDQLLYAAPSVFIYQPLTAIFEKLKSQTLLLTPFITRPPADDCLPDEKYFQNTGLYTSDFLAFRRTTETDRLLNWWQSRATEKAFVDFCEGLCLDQLWLMHALTFFDHVSVVKDPGWNVGIWNLHERLLKYIGNDWLVNGQEQLLFVNFIGLLNPDEGLFPYQNRFKLSERPEVKRLIQEYRAHLKFSSYPELSACQPAYGLRPEPTIIRGWRYRLVQSLYKAANFVDTVSLPVID